jgi:hypothetical protein
MTLTTQRLATGGFDGARHLPKITATIRLLFQTLASRTGGRRTITAGNIDPGRPAIGTDVVFATQRTFHIHERIAAHPFRALTLGGKGTQPVLIQANVVRRHVAHHILARIAQAGAVLAPIGTGAVYERIGANTVLAGALLGKHPQVAAGDASGIRRLVAFHTLARIPQASILRTTVWTGHFDARVTALTVLANPGGGIDIERRGILALRIRWFETGFQLSGTATGRQATVRRCTGIVVVAIAVNHHLILAKAIYAVTGQMVTIRIAGRILAAGGRTGFGQAMT